ncbi:MAG: hypothetical protein IJP48_06225 [Synergistaceae bacterium]|nr:hypothetical protein [Synergistaceae bacterium]
MSRRNIFKKTSSINKTGAYSQLPITLCLDTSGSMRGHPINELNAGMRMFYDCVKHDCESRYSADISNLALIEALKSEIELLSSMHAQSYEAHAVNSISDSVATVTARKLTLEKKIKKIALRISPVERLLEELRYKTTCRISQMDLILRLRYFEKYSVNGVMREGGLSYSTYWRRNRELLQTMKKYLSECKT